MHTHTHGPRLYNNLIIFFHKSSWAGPVSVAALHYYRCFIIAVGRYGDDVIAPRMLRRRRWFICVLFRRWRDGEGLAYEQTAIRNVP